MATTIRINDETKERLDKIRARLILQNKKLTQEELIEFIVKLAETNPMILDQEQYQGPTTEEQARFFSLTFKGGTSSKSIDEEIYS